MATKTNTSTKPAAANGQEFVDFFIDELKDIYWAEKHLAKALPKMQKAATSPELAAAFEKHTQETEEHVTILENVFSLLDAKAAAKKCDAMAGLLEEASGIIEETDKGTAIRDAALILGAQKVEHYEIATYGTLVRLAKTMGRTDVADELLKIFENEKLTDETLTELAESMVNEMAVAE
jgi:ferritin-like metal-binding protein YciE